MSWLLAIALLGVLGFVVIRDNLAGPEPPTLTTVTGVIGSEKVPFFADERVREVFRANGLEVRVDPAGSRQIATTVRLDDYDFAFPSSSPVADKVLATRPAARTYAPFSTPMAVATFAPIVDLLTQAGVVAPGSSTFDVQRYLELASAGTRWDQLPGNTSFPARKDVLLSTTAPCQSNSAIMYLGIASYVANADSVVADQSAAAQVAPAVQPLFRDQGYLPPSTEVLFEDYLSAGMGRVPMALIYEAQYLAESLSARPGPARGRAPALPEPDDLLAAHAGAAQAGRRPRRGTSDHRPAARGARRGVRVPAHRPSPVRRGVPGPRAAGAADARRRGGAAVIRHLGGHVDAARMRTVRRIAAVAAAVLTLVAGCGGDGDDSDGGSGSRLAVGPADASVTLRVLAGSELLDLEPVLAEAATATDVRIELDPIGTLDGAEAVASGTAEADHDAIWFSSNRYLALQPDAAGPARHRHRHHVLAGGARPAPVGGRAARLDRAARSPGRRSRPRPEPGSSPTG